MVFTPLLSSIGGLLMGIATSFNLWFTGRISGFSGIAQSVFTFGLLDSAGFRWKAVLTSGMWLGGAISYYTMRDQAFQSPASFATGLSIWGFLLAGFFVGLGTRMANGCTSGHGLCGLPRLSIRSIVATMTFLITAIVVANVKARNPIDFLDKSNYDIPSIVPETAVLIFIAIGVVIPTIFLLTAPKSWKDSLASLIAGVIFGFALGIAGMSQRLKVLNFLIFDKSWDASLLFILGCGVVFNFIAFRLILKGTPYLSGYKFGIPSNTKVDARLVVGSIIFGIGWGLGGICPGPAITVMTQGYGHALLLFTPAMAVGMLVMRLYDSRRVLSEMRQRLLGDY